jgi:arsenate reductase (thioredoxin)
MAAAFLRHHAGDRIAVRSAGTAPADHINPIVIEAMAEVGIDILAAGAHPKKLSDATVQTSDVVITMGCGDHCPIFPGVEYLDWSLPDPAGRSIEAIRPIRDNIEHLVLELVDRLLLRPQGSPR